MSLIPATAAGPVAAGVRLDKWLWAARLYKTRSLAADEVGRGRVRVNGQAAKAARLLRPGDRLSVQQGSVPRELNVLALSSTRGPAPVAFKPAYVRASKSLDASMTETAFVIYDAADQKAVVTRALRELDLD